MSSRDTTVNQSQPQHEIVVYETSDSPQDGLGSRLDATPSQTTIRTASDPVGLVETLTESATETDCLVCAYGSETTAATESLYELLASAAPGLPRVAYVESPNALAEAHELGFSAVHLRRETDDIAAITARIRAAINATPEASADPEPQRLVAATIDSAGTVRRIAGDGHATQSDTDSPLWRLPWAPQRAAVESAVEAAVADPEATYRTDTADDAAGELIVVAGPATTSTNGEQPADGGRITVLGAVDHGSSSEGPPSEATDEPPRATEVERYEQILETVSDGVYALNPAGEFTYVNQGLADLTGYSRSELIGSHVSICKSESTVERAEQAVRDRISRLKADAGATGEISLDLEIETAGGESAPCTDHIALLPFDDRFRGSVGMLRDVSAQQKREQTLSGLLTVTRALMAAETTGDVADLMVETVADVLGYDRAVVHLVVDDSERLLPEAATDTVHSEVGTLNTAVAGEGPIGSVFESGTTHRYEAAEAAVSYGAAELITVPLGSYGTLTVGASDVSSFNESDRQLVQLLTANAEEALNRTKRRQTLRRYEMILESVQEMMCVVDTTGQIKLLTDPLARRLDADRPQLVGTQLSAILQESVVDSTGGALADLFADQSTGDITFKDSMRIGDGESVPVSVEASQLPPVEGDPEAIVTIHDISDLISAKEAAAAERERFTYLFENLADPVDEIRLDDELAIKGVNNAFRSQFGDPEAVEDGLSGRAPIALDDGRIVESEIQDSLSNEVLSEGEGELKITTNEGTKYFLYRSVPYELDDERCGFEIYTNITALKQREIQLQVLHRLLRHNLRNDLNVIEGFAEMLKTELSDDTHRQFAARIHSNATQLAELSETAKTIESVAGHRSLDREPIAIGELVRATVESCAQTYDEAKIFFEALPTTTVSAGPHLETALSELIENAIEHNDTTPPKVSITVEVEAETETATVIISDNGPGIPPEEWAVVTGDTEISQLEHGSGLGLWLVRWVTEGYGGELNYHLEEIGSTISIQLPLAEADS